MGRHKAPISDEEMMKEVASEFIESAEEDLALIRDMRDGGFKYPHNACMIMARSTEKIMKAKLLLSGSDADFIHDQVELMIQLGFSENDPVLAIAAEMSEYATQANYPSRIRKGITPSTAADSYKRMVELLNILRSTEPVFEISAMPEDEGHTCRVFFPDFGHEMVASRWLSYAYIRARSRVRI